MDAFTVWRRGDREKDSDGRSRKGLVSALKIEEKRDPGVQWSVGHRVGFPPHNEECLPKEKKGVASFDIWGVHRLP